MAVITKLGPQMLVLLGFVFHQIISRTTTTLILESNDVFIIFPVAVAHHIVVAQYIHICSINIAGNQARIFPLSYEPAIEHHKALAVRRQHQMVHLVDTTRHLHLRPRLEICEVRIFQ